MDIDDLEYEFALKNPDKRLEVLLDMIARWPQHRARLVAFFADLAIDERLHPEPEH